jgi:hypothetical protein
MERPLTVRQRRFAVGVASGLGKTAAHAAAYPNNMKRSTRETAAKQTAKIPKVAAAIEKLTLELLPPMEDLRAVYQHSLSAIAKLSIESRDDRVRFDCARWLRAECERNQQLACERTPPAVQEELETGRRALAILHALYAQMDQPASQGPLTLETQEGMVQSATGDLVQTPRELTTPVEVKGGQGPDSGRPENEPHSEPREKRVPIPGSFPPRFKIVRSE